MLNNLGLILVGITYPFLGSIFIINDSEDDIPQPYRFSLTL